MSNKIEGQSSNVRNIAKHNNAAVFQAGRDLYVTYNESAYTVKKIHFKQDVNCRSLIIVPTNIRENKKLLDMKVTFKDLLQLENPDSYFKDQLVKYNCESDYYQWVRQYLLEKGLKESSLMATSLANSCMSDSGNEINEKVKEIVKKYIENGEGKKKFLVFISAITSKNRGKERTIEYYAARIITKILQQNGIGVFWWENEDLKEKDWYVSTKIATGLALSSIFIGLAFDSVKLENSNDVDFICFDEKKGSPCFKYEMDMFKSFYDEESAHKKFVQDFYSGDDEYSRFFPKSRKFRVFSYGFPKNYKGYNRIFHNNENIRQVVISDAKDDAKKIQYIVKDAIKEIISIIKSDNEIKNLCATEALESADLDSIIQAELAQTQLANDYLFRPFDSSKFQDGMYADNFLDASWGKDEGISWIADGVKENIESVPTDYFFKYAIIDTTGKNVKNHFIVFPERYNDDKGNFVWRLKLVVRDWNLRAVVETEREYRRFLLGDNEVALYDNPLFPLSNYTNIAFYKDKCLWSDVGQQPADAYATRAEYSGICNEEANNINNGINNNCSFVLCEDLFAPQAPIYSLKGLICLTNDKDSTKYPVCFYISLIFYPKQIVYCNENVCGDDTHIYLKKTSSSFMRDGAKPTSLKCPYCGRIMTSKKSLKGDAKGNSIYCYSDITVSGTKKFRTCEYNFIGYSYYLDDKKRLVKKRSLTKEVMGYGNFDEDSNTEYKQLKKNMGTRTGSRMFAITQESKQLRYDAKYKDGVVITMVGAAQSGKSTFISRLFSIEHGSYGSINGRNVNCTFLQSALKPYVGEVSACTVLTNEMNDNQSGDEDRRKGISQIRLLEDYGAEKYGEFLNSTPNDGDPILTHIPYMIELNGIQSNNKASAFLSFFDLPGALIAGGGGSIPLADKHDDFTMLFRSDSIILLLNNERENLGIKDVKEFLKFISSKVSSNIIVAVVLCKSDVFAEKIDREHKKYVRTDPPTSSRTKFGGSLRQRYIDACSTEVEDYIETGIGGEVASDLLKEIKRFKHKKFFAVSSIGRSDSVLKKVEGDKISIFDAMPFNLENVLLWIMFEKGIIE